MQKIEEKATDQIRVKPSTRKALKVLAAQYNKTMATLIESMVLSYQQQKSSR